MNQDPPKPQRDRRWKVHLDWMCENQPDLVRQLHSQGKLGPHLDRKAQQGMQVVLDQKAKGMSEDEAFDVALEKVLSPPEGPSQSENPPEPLPWQEARRICQELLEE